VTLASPRPITCEISIAICIQGGRLSTEEIEHKCLLTKQSLNSFFGQICHLEKAAEFSWEIYQMISVKETLKGFFNVTEK